MSTDASPPGSDVQRLYERYYPAIVAFFQRRGVGREEALDLAQETFLRVHRGMDTFRREARLETWLFKIATHVWLNHLRHRGALRRQHWEVSLEEALEQGLPVIEREARERAAEDPPQLAGLLREERVQRLRQAIAELAPRTRQIVLMRVDGGLKYREIAESLGLSIETVKVHLHQAKCSFQQQGAELTAEEVARLDGEASR